MKKMELQKILNDLTAELTRVQAEYANLTEKGDSFNERRELRQQMHQLNAHIEEINKQMKSSV